MVDPVSSQLVKKFDSQYRYEAARSPLHRRGMSRGRHHRCGGLGSRIDGLDFTTADLRGSVIVAANNRVTVSFVETSKFYMERGPSDERLDSERG